jgi:hypothetical protein
LAAEFQNAAPKWKESYCQLVEKKRNISKLSGEGHGHYKRGNSVQMIKKISLNQFEYMKKTQWPIFLARICLTLFKC